MGGEQRERKPIHAEGDAAAMHHRAGLIVQIQAVPKWSR